MANQKYKILGTTDERTSCECCGRQDLKLTVCLEEIDTGERVFFGTTCAAKAGKWTVKTTRAAARSADDETRRLEGIERYRARVFRHLWQGMLREDRRLTKGERA